MQRNERSSSAQLPEEAGRSGREDRLIPSEGARRALALQRTAGNRSVSGLLARAPDTAEPLDATQKAEKPKTEAAAGLATLPEIGAIPLVAINFSPTTRPSGPDSGGRGTPVSREISFVSKVGDHSTQLFRASAAGTRMPVVEVIAGGGSWRVKLVGAIVTSYTMSSQGGESMESWALNFESLELPSGGGSGG